MSGTVSTTGTVVVSCVVVSISDVSLFSASYSVLTVVGSVQGSLVTGIGAGWFREYSHNAPRVLLVQNHWWVLGHVHVPRGPRGSRPMCS